jgi:hypothetical protein
MQRMRSGAKRKRTRTGEAAARDARVERVLDRFADQRVGEILSLEEFVVHGIDVHFAQIHGAKVPGGKPGHRAIVRVRRRARSLRSREVCVPMD